MQNPKMLSRLLAAAVLSLASVAAVSVQAADVGATAAANSASPTTAPGASASDTGATTSDTGAATSGAGAATSGAGAATSGAGATSAYADDAMITTMVKAALIEDKQVKSLKIKVSTEQGVVKMSGTVPNAEVGNRALQLATTVQGVKGVKNDLKVKG